MRVCAVFRDVYVPKNDDKPEDAPSGIFEECRVGHGYGN